MTPAYLTEYTSQMPCKTIQINGADYLRRYYAGTFENDQDLWLHEFLTCDGERHLHCHPFESRSFIICGGYTEETPDGLYEHRADEIPEWLKLALLGVLDRAGGGGRRISVYDWHRIAAVLPGTWTAFIVDHRRLPMWCFRSEDGTLEPVKASPREWYLSHGPRAKNK